MRWMKPSYLTGRYNESPEGFLSVPGPALLASTLAWAAKNKVPFPDALRSLMDYGELKPIFFRLWPAASWEKALWLAHLDISNGTPLYQALRWRFSNYLPEYYLQAVESAEKDGRLEEVLPHFARHLNFSSDIKTAYASAIFGALLEFFVIGLLFVLVTVFIVPKFEKILHELISGYPMPAWFELLLLSVRQIGSAGSWLFLNFFYIIGGVIIFFSLMKTRRAYVMMFLEEILVRLPFFRKQLRDIARLELAASLSSYMSAGEDIVSAAKFSRKACRHIWYRKKIDKFIEKISQGGDWLDAWHELDLRDPFCDWLLRNAAARDNVIEGFDSMSDWLLHRVVDSSGRNMLYLFLAGIAINSMIVAFIAFAMFGSLAKIIEYLGKI